MSLLRFRRKAETLEFYNQSLPLSRAVGDSLSSSPLSSLPFIPNTQCPTYSRLQQA
ncbi:hypothetical protein COO91_10876 (plasmid) [Nostoc flagelliforme CCNUN1]|uniref:Uncharacterized protein n=1 Tax=Nostoc flagelliforme CCNUN1 TaxID=2038116 RepID=A0A2K8TAB2_9NOSO|nr:hypothetical protein COO91_10876 [Nostoc flagelliforme CCNUN1]